MGYRSSGEIKDGLAKSLAGDGTSGEASSSDRGSALDQRNTLTQLRGLNCAALPCRAAANADEIVVVGFAHRSLKLQTARQVGHFG
jgi:hypothetical protein